MTHGTMRAPMCGVLGALGILAACSPVERPWRADAAIADTAPVDATQGMVLCPTEDTWMRARAVRQLLEQHVYAPSEAFFACVRGRVFSPSSAAYAEEILARLRRFEPIPLACVDLSRSSAAAPRVVVTQSGMVVDEGALRAFDAVTVAARLVRAMTEAYGHRQFGTRAGEARNGVPPQVEDCLRIAAGAGPGPDTATMQHRDQMLVEQELQPFGDLNARRDRAFLLECPLGERLDGLGTVQTMEEGSARLVRLGVRCRTPEGVVTRIGRGGERWTDCPDGQRAVGIDAVASPSGVTNLRVVCAAWPRTTAEPTLLPFALAATSPTVLRRCPPGQVLSALHGASDSTRIASLAVVCRDPEAPAPVARSELAALGAPSSLVPYSNTRRSWCADQGVLVGVYGYSSARTGHLVRLGGICRGTALVADVLGFRQVSSGDVMSWVPEHILAGVGVSPAILDPPGVPFAEASGDAAGRCPVGTGLVGFRGRGGGDRTLRELAGLCAPLEAWRRGDETTVTVTAIVGGWSETATPYTERRCETAAFVAGLEIEQTDGNDASADVIELLRPLCRRW